MAASCPPLTNLGMNQSREQLVRIHGQKASILCAAGLGRCSCNSKLFLVPNEVIARGGKCRAYRHGHVSPCATSSDHLRRASNSSECSMKSSDDDFEELKQQLQELFDEVKRMVGTGKRQEADDLLQANYEIVKQRIDTGVKEVEEAATLDIIALGYMAVGDLKKVVSVINVLNGVVDILKDDEPVLDSVLMHMGSMYSAVGKLDRSVLAYQRAIGILESKHGASSPFLVPPLLGIAKSFGSIGRASKAVEVYHRVINILERSRGAGSEDLVVPLLHLGNLLIEEEKAADAEDPFSRVLNIYQNLYGERDGRVGMVLCSLAHAKFATGDADESIPLYNKALQILKETNFVAVDDDIMEKMRVDLAELLHIVGRGQEGRQLLEESLLISEKHKGKEHPNSVMHLMNLASSYTQCNNFAEAERLLRLCLGNMKTNTKADDQSISFPMLHLAATLHHLSRDEEAEELALEALGIREKAFGKDSVPAGEALDCLISIQGRLGKADTDILGMLKRVLKIQEREFGYESEDVMLTLKKILFYLDRLGRKDEKFPIQKRLALFRDKY